MKAKRCEKCKSYYNSDRYTVCPHCNTPSDASDKAKSISDNSPSEGKKKSDKNGFFEIIPKYIPIHKGAKEEKHFEKSDITDRNDVLSESKEVKVEDEKKYLEPEPIKKDDFSKERNMSLEDIRDKSDKISSDDFDKKNDADEKETKGSLAQAVAETNPVADMVTVARYNFSDEINPVVGWLIAVKGEYKGSAFILNSGNNNIGRSLTNAVALAKERTVSRERHASIIFDPDNNKFFIKPGESSGLTYVNNELLLSVRELNSWDKIRLGAVEFVFVPLCSEYFSWDEYSED